MQQLILNNHWSRALYVAGGALWTWIEPTIPFALLCIFAVLIDCLSAWRLNRRIRARYGPAAADGKLKSHHMGKMVSDLLMLFSVMLIAQGVDDYVLPFAELYLGNFVAAVFLIKTIVSILENESSQNGNTWARAVQKFVMDKTKRHLEIDIEEITTPHDETQQP